MKSPPQRIVIGEFSEEGYEVQVVVGSRIVHSYAAGNHRQDSGQSATPGAREALRLRDIRTLCVRTAKDIAQEHRARFAGVRRHRSQSY